MNFGMASLPTFRFVLAGFWVVMCVGLGLGLVYFVGAQYGRRAAQNWVRGCVAVLLGGGAVTIGWAVMSGQWERFMLTFGPGPLSEMLMLAVLFLGTMWFMALRYTQGLND